MHQRSAPRRSTDTVPARRALRLLTVLTIAAGLVLSVGPVPPAAADGLPDGVRWEAEVNGVNVRDTSSERPVRLDPGRPAEVRVRIENRSAEPLSVPFVRLHGEVLGLTFYSYTTRVDMELAPGGGDTREFTIDLLDLGDQAKGLVPSQVSLLDGRAEVQSTKHFAGEVEGETTSVYGVFGLAVAALTLVLLVGGLWRLATGRLHPNRWRRGVTLAAPGLGVGFVVTFTLAAAAVTMPRGTMWAGLMSGGAAIGFLAGYLSPTPGEHDEDEDRYADDGGPEDDVPDDGEPTEAWIGDLVPEADGGAGVPELPRARAAERDDPARP
jgi:hypothetical protein